jgi:Family of unknown function (DUF6275)
MARQIAADNYNMFRDPNMTKPMSPEDFFFVWFTKVSSGWRAILGSSLLTGLIYDVSYTAMSGRATVNCYRKVRHSRVETREPRNDQEDGHVRGLQREGPD